jgi:hypothetical protein
MTSGSPPGLNCRDLDTQRVARVNDRERALRDALPMLTPVVKEIPSKRLKH